MKPVRNEPVRNEPVGKKQVGKKQVGTGNPRDARVPRVVRHSTSPAADTPKLSRAGHIRRIGRHLSSNLPARVFFLENHPKSIRLVQSGNFHRSRIGPECPEPG
jgi:hypothetical protein